MVSAEGRKAKVIQDLVGVGAEGRKAMVIQDLVGVGAFGDCINAK